MAALPLILAIALGWALYRLTFPWPRRLAGWAEWIFSIALATGLGAGVSSVIYFLLLLAGGGGRLSIAAAEIFLLSGCGLLIYRRMRLQRSRKANPLLVHALPMHPWERMAALLLAAGIVVAAVTFYNDAAANPHGQWDAWSIWNLRAKFLISSRYWRNAYSSLLDRTHPDYPLLVSAFIARSWKYLGHGAPVAVPIAIAGMFEFAVIGLLISSSVLLRGRASGLLAGLVLVGTPAFLRIGPWQYADIPLSLYILGSLALLCAANLVEVPRRPALALAGVFASLAAWTKNEGLLFFAVLTVVVFLSEGFSSRWTYAGISVGWFVIGSLPVIAVTLYFKFCLAPVTDPLVTQPLFVALSRLDDFSRYVTILKAFCEQIIGLGDGWMHPVIALGILSVAIGFHTGDCERRWMQLAGTTIMLVMAGYFVAYLITPADLQWHLNTSLNRLCMHAWPSFLLLFFLILRRPEDSATAPDQRETFKVTGKKARSAKRA